MGILPSIPPETLRDLAFFIMPIPFLVKVYLLLNPLLRAKKKLEGHTFEAVELVKKLEIPGVKNFIRREVILLFSPYLVIFLVFSLSEISTVSLFENGFYFPLIAALGLVIWAAFDGRRSMESRETLNDLLDEVDNFESRIGEYGRDLMWGLRMLVGFREGLKSASQKISDAISSSQQASQTGEDDSRTEQIDELPLKSGEPWSGPSAVNEVLGKLAKAADAIINAPIRLTQVLIDKMLGQVDEVIESHFSDFTEKPFNVMLSSFIWTLIPVTWLLVLTYLYPA